VRLCSAPQIVDLGNLVRHGFEVESGRTYELTVSGKNPVNLILGKWENRSVGDCNPGWDGVGMLTDLDTRTLTVVESQYKFGFRINRKVGMMRRILGDECPELFPRFYF